MTGSGIDQLLTSACCTRQSERAFKFEAFRAPSALCGSEQVSSAKLLGDIFQNNLSFDQHVAAVLKCCSQRAYILKLFRDQGTSQTHLDTVFHALVMPKIRYALCAWGGFLTQIQKGLISAFVRRMYKYHFARECFDIDFIMGDMDRTFLK